MAGQCGAKITCPEGGSLHGWAFGEDQARYIAVVSDVPAFTALCAASEVEAIQIGETISECELTLAGLPPISKEDMVAWHSKTIDNLMG